VASGGEDAHVGPDLGEDVLCAAPRDAGDRAQQLNGGRERGKALLDRVREPVDLLVEEVEVREDRADQQRVQLVEACGVPKLRSVVRRTARAQWRTA